MNQRQPCIILFFIFFSSHNFSPASANLRKVVFHVFLFNPRSFQCISFINFFFAFIVWKIFKVKYLSSQQCESEIARVRLSVECGRSNKTKKIKKLIWYCCSKLIGGNGEKERKIVESSSAFTSVMRMPSTSSCYRFSPPPLCRLAFNRIYDRILLWLV